MSYDLIIFDCDGTLVDSEMLNNLAVVEILQAHGHMDYTLERSLNEFTGLRFGNILKKVTAETGYAFPSDTAASFLKAVARLSAEHMKPIDGALEAVTIAAERMKTCVASNGERSNVLASLEFAGLSPFFPDEKVYTALMVENPKPAPDLFLYAAAQQGVEPARCLVIEDSVAGVTAARAAGMDVWGFCGTHHDSARHVDVLKSHGAAFVATDMAKISARFSAFSPVSKSA